MKRAIALIKFDVSRGNVLEFEVNEPGTPLHAFVQYEQAGLLLVKDRDPQMVAVPMLIIQVDPDAPKRRRRYVAVFRNMVLDSTELGCDELIYVATIINPNDGQPMVIYEAPLPAQPSLAAQLAEAAIEVSP